MGGIEPPLTLSGPRAYKARAITNLATRLFLYLIMNNIITCLVCGASLTGKQVKYCSKECKNSGSGANNYEAQKLRAITRKKYLIDLKGGVCEICGYSKNIAAMEFHHIIPSLKEIKLDSRSISNHSMDKLIKEVAKCQLLCANCHRELHN